LHASAAGQGRPRSSQGCGVYHRGEVALESGARLGPYEVLSPLGAGGMGEVYRGRDTRLGRTIALKILPESLAHNERLKIRFEREARAISALNHPHICALYDVGDSYLVMEYCEGETLAQRLARGPLPLDEALRYGLQMADALDKAHRQRIIHRDLKPSNVMVTAEGIKLLDFGLAKEEREISEEATTAELITGYGMIVGTVPYMAPEVLRGRSADALSDLFALGLILYEMVCGKRAFEGATLPALTAAILETDPVPVAELNPSVPPALDLLIRACLEKNPEERIQTANDIRLHLRSISEGAATSPRARLFGPPLAGRRFRHWRAVAVGAAACVAAAVAWRQWPRSALLPGPIHSLAVLPFQSLSEAPDDYVVAGIQDGVLGELSQVSALRVISRTSAMHYQGTRKTVPEIARELGVDAIVEGSVRRSGKELGVQATLVRAGPQERQVWSKSYERNMAGATALQTDIARGVALATQVTLTPGELARLSRERTPTTEGYESYLKGMFYVRKLTPQGARQGLTYLEDAVSKSPLDPAAHAGLALAYAILGHSPSPPSEVEAKAKAEARKAIALDDTIAEAHAALGAIAMYLDWDWETAARELRRALELNPSSAETHRDYAWFLELAGPNRSAIVEMKRATELDPLTPLYATDLGWLYYRAGRVDDAARQERQAEGLDPKDPLAQMAVAVTCSEAGAHDEAIAAGERLAVLSPVWRFGLAYAYAKAGRKADAEKAAAEAAKTTAPISSWGLAYAYAALGDKDEALRWVEKGVEERFGFLLWMKDTPGFATLRGDPRFEALVQSMKLPTPSALASLVE
jgi:eukaryotic-like serine/threonine-protein kinase